MTTNQRYPMLMLEDFGFDSRGDPAPALPKWFNRLDVLGGLAAAEIYWLYAIFVAHVLTVSVYVTDRTTQLRVLSGQIGDLSEAVHWSGVIPSLAVSLGLFALVWCVVRGSSWALSRE